MRRKILLSVAGICALWAGARILSGKYSSQAEMPAEAAIIAEAKDPNPGRAPASTASPGESDPSWSSIPLSEEEKHSALTLVKLQAGAESLNSSKTFVAALEQAHLVPSISRDSNPSTGTLEIVRTENALPGTRYLHAQFFEMGDQKNDLPQHISFEIRPGSDSMQVALEMIRKAYGDLGKPEMQTADYVLWRTKSRRVISAKRLNAEDLENSYFNAHSTADVGTIWVVNEIDPEAS